MNNLSNFNKKKILMITTGGTIASTNVKNSLEPTLSGDYFLSLIPELSKFFNIDVYSLFNIDSTDMTPEKQEEIAILINEKYSIYDGFVVTHGTDTMAYTSSMLHYLLSGIDKPVILTGSQRPIDDADTDAINNLKSTFEYLKYDSIKGVFLSFNNKLFYGNKVTKTDTTSMDAFSCVNSDYAAVIEDTIVNIKCSVKDTDNTFCLRHLNSDNILLIKLYPGINPMILKELCLSENGLRYNAVILETFGAGGIPDTPGFSKILKALEIIETKVYSISQCINGASVLDKYEVGTRALSLGVTSLYDMSAECALAYLKTI